MRVTSRKVSEKDPDRFNPEKTHKVNQKFDGDFWLSGSHITGHVRIMAEIDGRKMCFHLEPEEVQRIIAMSKDLRCNQDKAFKKGKSPV